MTLRTERMRVFLARHLFSSLAGVSAGDWLRLLAANRCAVHPAYWPRAALLSFASVPTSVDRRRELLRFGAAIDAVTVPPPLFVLGHWRTGTTHLHNLLAADPRFAAPNLFQTFNPHTFLLNEDKYAPLVAPWIPGRRLMDNVKLGVSEPQEDEFALATLTGLSPYLSWAFPRRRAHYDRTLTFDGVPAADVNRWKAAFLHFAKKLTLKTGRPLVLKSPPHTARIRLLLELFPEAKFVHVRRDPYAVFQSTRHLEATAAPALALQVFREPDPDGRILRRYATLYDAYLTQAKGVPEGRLCEVRYEDLVADPIGQLGRVYGELDLPDFAAAKPAVEDYLRSVTDFRPNAFRPLEPADRRRVAEAWAKYFDAFGYPT